MSKQHESVRRSDAPPTWVLVLGMMLMFVAFASCAVLSWSHIQESPVVGCGGGVELGGSAAQVTGSGCDRAKDSVWSALPVIGWPTAHMGMAWFAAMTHCWTIGRGRLVGPARWLGLLGGLVSLFLIGVMLVDGYLCRWCALAHGANLAFLALALLKGGRKGPQISAVMLGMTLTFAGVTSVLLLAELLLSPTVEDVVPASEFKVRPQVEVEPSDSVKSPSSGLIRSTPLKGRWRIGPVDAPIRLVMFTDPQCPDCKRVHGELEAILEERDDISVEVKFFLFCKDCNERAAQQNLNLHPNACWGATVAELAGEYGGPKAFHRMLGWLFSVDGKFTSAAALQPGFAKAGITAHANDIVQAISGTGSLPLDKKKLLEADAREGVDLGLYYTPMAFLNGQEVKDVLRPGALRRAVETLSATDPEKGTSAGDYPSTALGRLVSDWQEGPRPNLGPDLASLRFGPDTAKPVVVIGDMAEDGFRRDVPTLLESADAGKIQLEVRLLPTNKAVNPASGFPQPDRWVWGGQAAIRIGQLRQDGDLEGAKKLFRELLKAPQPMASLQNFVQSRPELLGREEAPILDEVANAQRRWASLRAYGVRGLPVLVIDGRLAARTQIQMSDGSSADALSEILQMVGD